MTPKTDTPPSFPFTVREVSAAEAGRLRSGYALLQRALGAGGVEDLGSFCDTVSPATDDAIVPKLVSASRREEIAGFIVGAYLCNLNMGFIAYSAVEKGWRRRGVYTAMRGLLIALLDREAEDRDPAARTDKASPGRRRMHYVISELAEHSDLYRRYIREWGAFVLPCAYEQPAAQGLRAQGMKLVLQPMGREVQPGEDEMAAIVREIYERVYRIPDVDENPAFRRVVASIKGRRPMLASQEAR